MRCMGSFKHDSMLCRELESTVHYSFTNRGAALQAITHCSYHGAANGCYQRLELLGDAALDLQVTDYCFTQYR